MKKLTYIFILFLFVGSNYSFAQSSNLENNTALFVKRTQIAGNSYGGRTLQNCISGALKKDYLMSYNALVQLEPFANLGEERVIEGMDTYTYIDIEVGFVLKNGITAEEKKWTTNVKGKGSNLSAATTDGLKKICRDPKNKSAFKTFVKNYLDELGTTNCNQIVSAIQQMQADKKFNDALLALDYIADDSSCASSKKQLETSILSGLKEQICAEHIQKASVLAHSGISGKMQQAINLLVQIPPDATCAKEAIELAKVIGEKNESINAKSQEQLNRQLIILNENNQSEWRSQYRRQLYSRRR